MSKKNWTVKVVKVQRGGQGEWFRYPAAYTSDNEADAIAYAERFAADQKGVAGTKIQVITRKGGDLVKSISV